jgi:hypothetical protein
MKEGHSGFANQVLISSDRELLRSKAVMVSVAETPGADIASQIRCVAQGRYGSKAPLWTSTTHFHSTPISGPFQSHA